MTNNLKTKFDLEESYELFDRFDFSKCLGFFSVLLNKYFTIIIRFPQPKKLVITYSAIFKL